MDFSKLSRPSGIKKPTKPDEIFSKLPNLPGTPNDLWRGQSIALSEWHENRTASDVLISLNTGAGKTIVGLLIAQSLCNEGVDNVVYACSTIDLVWQTAKEADRLGLKYTTRVKGEFNNDLFEIGEAFCITTYAALFTSLSCFHTRHYPRALIFDDAHVAEQLMRSQFTLSIERESNSDLYFEIINLFKHSWNELGRGQSFEDVSIGKSKQILMAPPSVSRTFAEPIAALLRNHNIPEHITLKYPYHHLKDNLKHCAILFGNQMIEISPPFLPVMTLPYLADSSVRRIYLSATLTSIADLARAFGRVPQKIIRPEIDAGNGERLILFSKHFPSGEINSELMSNLIAIHKVLLAVPSYARAENWKKYAVPSKPEQFSKELEQFRDADTGVFILVSRLDGIDLPDRTCRVMAIDDLPSGSYLLEKFQWEVLHMHNFYTAKIANRLTQLFGRINRGRNDYSAFIINGRELNTWMYKDRNLALLPMLLRKQILIGKALHQEMNIGKPNEVADVINSVLSRNQSWLDFYSGSMEMDIDAEVSKDAKRIQDLLTKAAISETQFVSALWEQDYATARRALEEQIENVARADTKVAGWHNVWIGLCLEIEGDLESAQAEYDRARDRLERQIVLPRGNITIAPVAENPNSALERKMLETVSLTSENAFQREIGLFSNGMVTLDNPQATAKQAEASVRLLGERLGFLASRPDNDPTVCT
jgi:tetratricopeptide (TPR) repeat protein